MRVGSILVVGILLLAGLGRAAHAAPAPDSDPLALADAGHFKRARSLAEARLKSNPADAEALAALSAVQSAFGDDEVARASAQKAVDLAPENPRCRFQLARTLGSLAQKASIFRQLGLAHDFRREIDKTLALAPSMLDAQFALLEFYLVAPGIAGGDRTKAQGLASSLAASDRAASARARARIAQEDKDVPGQERAYREALEASPQDSDALVLLASLYLGSEHKPDLALEAAQRAIAADPGREAPYAIAVEALVAEGRLADLDPLLQEAEKNVGDDLDPYYQAGRTLLLAGKDLPRAEAYFRRFVGGEPEGEKPDLAHAHWRLALVLEKEGRKTDAAAECEAALRLRPDFKEARSDLKRLQ